MHGKENDKIIYQVVYLLFSGSVFEGVWINNKKNGKGKYTTPNGDKIEGTFYDDKLTVGKKREDPVPLRPSTPLTNAIGRNKATI